MILNCLKKYSNIYILRNPTFTYGWGMTKMTSTLKPLKPFLEIFLVFGLNNGAIIGQDWMFLILVRAQLGHADSPGYFCMGIHTLLQTMAP